LAKCAACGSTILFGGKRNGESRYCDAQCHDHAGLLAIAGKFPAELVRERALAIHRGACPDCGGRGPVDVRTGYRVWSALLLTSWRSLPHICCRSCGIKSQALDTLYSLLLGWWAFPWGLVVTPIQLGRNFAAMLRRPDPLAPSERLESCVRITLAVQASVPPARQPESKTAGISVAVAKSSTIR